MKLSRIVALLAAPAVISLAACGGGSTTSFANATGSTANVRFVNGAPTAGPLDIYFQSTGANPPSNPIVNNIAFGVASDFLTNAAVSGNIVATNAGTPAPSTGAVPRLVCPVPQFANNAKYSIVIVMQNGLLNCSLFQDFDYTGAPQYRVHDAAINSALSSTAGFGTISAPSAPSGTPFTVQVVGPQGNRGLGNNGAATSYTQALPTSVPAFTGSITFAVGTATSGTGVSLATLDSRYIFAPNGTTQPNSSGALNVTGSVGTSLFALDCTTAPATNVNCTNGIALVGYTDRL